MHEVDHVPAAAHAHSPSMPAVRRSRHRRAGTDVERLAPFQSG
jgi:hypothetical protein